MPFDYTRARILTLTGSLHARVLAMASESKCAVITRTLHDLGGHVLASKPFRASFSTCIDSLATWRVANIEKTCFSPSRKCAMRSTGIMTPYHVGHKLVQERMWLSVHTVPVCIGRGRGGGLSMSARQLRAHFVLIDLCSKMVL